MTPKEVFWQAYQRVCKARSKAVDPDHAAEVWRVVERFSPSLFDAVATRLNAEAQFFPSSQEWVATCRAIDGEEAIAKLRRYADEADGYRGQRLYHCHICEDTGWEPGKCTAMEWCNSCRKRGHRMESGSDYIHTFVRACLCRETNPVYQAKRAANRKQQPGDQKGRAA